MASPASVIFQSAKLGNLPLIVKELERAETLLNENRQVGRIYGISGGSLVALAFALATAAKLYPEKFSKASTAIKDFRDFLTKAHSGNIRSLNFNPLYGPCNLNPLRKWLTGRLEYYTGNGACRFSDLGIPLYLNTIDRDAYFTLWGLPDESLQCDYQFIHIGPPHDAPIADALISAVSTMLSTSPSPVEGKWVYDCRPSVVDAGAIVADLEASDPRPILRTRPYTPIRNWDLNFITSPFIMHSMHERNQALLADYYLDLLRRQRELLKEVKDKQPAFTPDAVSTSGTLPSIGQVNLPYVGSTEAATNMRQSVENRVELMERFGRILNGQLDNFPFDRPANVIYGAGGFSGILAGMVATKAVDEGFKRGGGEIKQIYGVSAGVLNGFFHAVQVAAQRRPDIYKPAARHALEDLENLVAHLEFKMLMEVNKNPLKFWHGWANLGPLERFLTGRLTAYTGISDPAKLTFDDISLPMTVTAARSDGFTEFMGMTTQDRQFDFGGKTWKVRSAPVIKALIAGWTMNTYIEPTELNGEKYRDGGGTFYDPSMLVACLDPELTNLIAIHLNHPEKNTYELPDRPTVARIILDQHNYTFPEEHRRMRMLSNLFYDHFRLRKYASGAGIQVEPDFRRHWKLQDTGYL
jgi:predicted acylesterase/phospholipase RssA